MFDAHCVVVDPLQSPFPKLLYHDTSIECLIFCTNDCSFMGYDHTHLPFLFGKDLLCRYDVKFVLNNGSSHSIELDKLYKYCTGELLSNKLSGDSRLAIVNSDNSLTMINCAIDPREVFFELCANEEYHLKIIDFLDERLYKGVTFYMKHEFQLVEYICNTKGNHKSIHTIAAFPKMGYQQFHMFDQYLNKEGESS